MSDHFMVSGTSTVVVLPAGSVIVSGTVTVPTSWVLSTTTWEDTPLAERSLELGLVALIETSRAMPVTSRRVTVTFSGAIVGGAGFEQPAASVAATRRKARTVPG